MELHQTEQRVLYALSVVRFLTNSINTAATYEILLRTGMKVKPEHITEGIVAFFQTKRLGMRRGTPVLMKHYANDFSRLPASTRAKILAAAYTIYLERGETDEPDLADTTGVDEIIRMQRQALAPEEIETLGEDRRELDADDSRLWLEVPRLDNREKRL